MTFQLPVSPQPRLDQSGFLTTVDFTSKSVPYNLFGRSFFAELQRRKVYRVAAAYIVAAAFIIQIGSAVFPAWELPSWTLRLVVVLLLVGFPVALILAWAYDVTPQGIQATPIIPGRHRRRNIVLLVAAGAVISIAAGFFLLPRASARKIDKSVAVLPFENLSDEKENVCFTPGHPRCRF